MLQAMGLRLPPEAVDGTGSATPTPALSDAMVSVGPAGRGGTGSFISPDGLIITNHHVALDAVRQASDVEHDYSLNGFVANSRSEELAGPDYEVRITRSVPPSKPTGSFARKSSVRRPGMSYDWGAQTRPSSGRSALTMRKSPFGCS